MVSLTSANIEINPAHYVGAPRKAWESILKKTCAILDLLIDSAMDLMIESGIRGCVCTISKRYAKANNPELVPENNANNRTFYISYLDTNNLNGWVMCQFLPSGHFSWLGEVEWGHQLVGLLAAGRFGIH